MTPAKNLSQDIIEFLNCFVPEHCRETAKDRLLNLVYSATSAGGQMGVEESFKVFCGDDARNQLIALCRRHNSPAVNTGAHLLAGKVLEILGVKE